MNFKGFFMRTVYNKNTEGGKGNREKKGKEEGRKRKGKRKKKEKKKEKEGNLADKYENT